MYATADRSQIYHLLDGNHAATLCGREVAQVVLSLEKDAPLHLVKDKPRGYSLCQHCEKAREEAETDH